MQTDMQHNSSHSSLSSHFSNPNVSPAQVDIVDTAHRAVPVFNTTSRNTHANRHAARFITFITFITFSHIRTCRLSGPSHRTPRADAQHSSLSSHSSHLSNANL